MSNIKPILEVQVTEEANKVHTFRECCRSLCNLCAKAVVRPMSTTSKGKEEVCVWRLAKLFDITILEPSTHFSADSMMWHGEIPVP